MPGSPHASDDEFTTTDTSDPITGWTTLGSAFTVLNAHSDYESHLHMAKTAPGAFNVYGVYKASPTNPFTVTCKLTDCRWDGAYKSYGLLLAEASPGKLFTFGVQFSSGTPVQLWTNRTSRSTYSGYGSAHEHQPYKYLRLVVTSDTQVACYTSTSGHTWNLVVSPYNPNFTIGQVGLYMSGGDNDVACEASFDWIRFA